jgi:hypothetical protein
VYVSLSRHLCMKPRRQVIFAASWAIFAFSNAIDAQVAVGPPASPSASPALASADQLKDVNLDRAIGAVPAFDALGLSPESVTTPSTPRDLATDLLNGVDKNGVLQHGVAIETAPFRLIGIRTGLSAYRGNGETDVGAMITRWIYNFSTSIATSKATDKSDAVQLALGFKEVLYESADHDPYRNSDLDEAFAKAAQGELSNVSDFGPSLPEVSASAKKLFLSAVDDFYKNKWHGMIWTAAIAPTWNSDSGKLSDLTGTGFTTWSALAYGTPKDSLKISGDEPINVQVIGELRYREGEHVVDPNDKTHIATENNFLAAGRLRMGTDTFNGFAEGGYVRVWHGLSGDGNSWRGAVGVEKKITPNIWLVLTAGEQFGDASVKTNNLYAVSSLRIGTADKAQFSSQ